jgi:hypothetical protein
MTRQDAILQLLTDQLVRVGRGRTLVTVRADHSVALSDDDGAWEGPMPYAFGVLVTCPDAGGTGEAFWALFRAAT